MIATSWIDRKLEWENEMELNLDTASSIWKVGPNVCTLSSMSLKTVSVSKQYPTHKSYHKTTSITNNYYYYTIVNASTEK